MAGVDMWQLPESADNKPILSLPPNPVIDKASIITKKSDNLGKIEGKYLVELLKARRSVEELQAKLKEANIKLESVKKIVIAQFKGVGAKSQKMEDGALISLVVKKVYTASTRDKVKFVKEINRLDALTVNAQTFGKICKEEVAAEHNLPPYIKQIEIENLSIRGA